MHYQLALCAYNAGYNEVTDLLSEEFHRISVKDFDDSRSVADSGIGSSDTGSTYSEGPHFSRVRTKSSLAS